MEQNESFRYTYSAKQQQEIRRIREKYLPKEPDKMEQLRRLDASVTHKANSIAIAIGIAGTLLLGVGMCCCMVWAGGWFIPGIGIGAAGIGIIAAAYPVYNRVIRKERERIAPLILSLAEELLHNDGTS